MSKIQIGSWLLGFDSVLRFHGFHSSPMFKIAVWLMHFRKNGSYWYFEKGVY